MPLVRHFILSALLLPGLCACGTLYLHNAAAQDATATAKTELDKVNLSVVFDNEAAYLDELQKLEYAAVAESLGAQRDYSLLKILRGNAGSEGNGRRYLESRIDGYLQALAGKSDRGGRKTTESEPPKLWRIIADARKDATDDLPFTEMLDQGLTAGVDKLVPPDVKIPSLLSPSETTLADAIKQGRKATQELNEKKQHAKAQADELKKKLEAAAKDLNGGASSQEAFTGLLAKINAILRTPQDDPFLSQLVAESMQDKLDRLVKITDPKGLDAPGDSESRAAIGFVNAAFGVGDAFATPPRVPHPNALAAAQAWLKYVASEADTQVARAEARESLARAQLAAVSEQVYYLSRAGQALNGIESAPNLASTEGLVKLLGDKDKQTSARAYEAIYYYTCAWTKGFIPAKQLNEVAGPLIDRRAKLQQSRRSGEAWLGTLKPAVATLASYGEGGLDPYVFAELLQAIGVAAIAIGVN
jgi:hypothetical protein